MKSRPVFLIGGSPAMTQSTGSWIFERDVMNNVATVDHTLRTLWTGTILAVFLIIAGSNDRPVVTFFAVSLIIVVATEGVIVGRRNDICFLTTVVIVGETIRRNAIALAGNVVVKLTTRDITLPVDLEKPETATATVAEMSCGKSVPMSGGADAIG